ncbi:hypothetical protein Tco_1141513 [Tanacetum coccineum]
MRSSSSSSSRSRYKHYTKEEILARTHCDCLLPVEMQVAWTITNPGRRFKRCPIFVKLMLSDVKFRRPLADLRIMPPTMTTSNVGQQTAASRGERMGRQTGRGGGRTGEQTGRGGGRTGKRGGRDLLPTIIAQVGDHISNQGINGSRNDNVADDSIHEDVRNVNVSNEQNRCSYKEFVACKTKEYDGKDGVVAYTRWVEKIEAVQDISGCGNNQKVKYSIGSLIGMLTDEVVMNGYLKRSGERRGDGGESSKEGNVKGNNRRARTGKVFATITNPIRKEYMGSAPKFTNCLFHHYPKTPCRMCTVYNRVGNFAKDYRAGPNMVTSLNTRNSTAARGACYECGSTDQYKSACPMLNRAPRQRGNCPNQSMAIEGDTMLFDSSADYSFISTTSMSLLDIKPSSLGFSYEIEIVSGQLVEINKVIRGWMDWLSSHRAEIVCHERVVRIPLPHGKMLKVFKEWTEEKVFPDDLSGLPPSREVDFRIDLIPRAIPIAKSPNPLAPTEMKELSNLLKELQDKGFIRPSSTPWEASVLFVKKKDGSFRMYLWSKYHRLRVHEDDIPKTAFRTQYGHFEFIVMPFGLTNAPATKEEHEMHLGLILDLLKKEKLDGIHVDPSKIEGVKNWEAPKSPTEVHLFLGPGVCTNAKGQSDCICLLTVEDPQKELHHP